MVGHINLGPLFEAVLLHLLPYVAGQVALWAAIGAACGLAVAGVASIVLARVNRDRPAWARAVAIVGSILAAGACGGLMGGCEGLLRPIEAGVTVREGVLTDAGRFAASYVVAVSLMGDDTGAVNDVVEGRRPFDAGAFHARVRGLDAAAMERLKAALPGSANVLVSLLRDHLAESLVDKLEVAATVKGFVATLPASGTMPFTALTDHTVEHFIVPTIVGPVREVVRGKQLVYGVAGVGAIVLAFVLVRLAPRRSLPLVGADPQKKE